MAGCDEFQVDIEKWLHGALGVAGRAPLEEHLGGCEPCRAYEAAARGAEAGLAASAGEAAARVDWGRVERGLRGGVPSAVRMLAVAVLVAAWTASMVWLSTPPALRGERLLRMLPALGLLLVLVGFVAAWSARRLTSLVDRGETLDTWRHVVWAQVTWARRMQWATAAIAMFLLYKALTGRAATFDPAVHYGGLALPVAAAWLYLRRVKVPRAEREARDLGIDTGARGS